MDSCGFKWLCQRVLFFMIKPVTAGDQNRKGKFRAFGAKTRFLKS